MKSYRLPQAPKGIATDILNAHKSPPAAHAAVGATSASDYADPKNFKYPINANSKSERLKKIRAAIAYFSRNADKTYTPGQATSVARRIYNAAKGAGIEVSTDWLEKFGLKTKSARKLIAHNYTVSWPSPMGMTGRSAHAG
jgi:hypothetical protein